MRFIILAITLAMTMCESVEEYPSPSLSELEGRFILKNAQCYCEFDDYDFSANELWFFPESSVAVSKGLGTDGLYVSSPNEPENYRLEGDIIEFLKSGKLYYFRIENENLVLSNIDDPQIADDEIVYYFEKGNALEECIDDRLVDEISVCPAIYAPVCGCDGFTYSNSCDATASGVISYTEGTCDSKS